MRQPVGAMHTIVETIQAEVAALRAVIETAVTIKLGLDVRAAPLTVCRQSDGRLLQPPQRLSREPVLALVRTHFVCGEQVYLWSVRLRPAPGANRAGGSQLRGGAAVLGRPRPAGEDRPPRRARTVPAARPLRAWQHRRIRHRAGAHAEAEASPRAVPAALRAARPRADARPGRADAASGARKAGRAVVRDGGFWSEQLELEGTRYHPLISLPLSHTAATAGTGLCHGARAHAAAAR